MGLNVLNMVVFTMVVLLIAFINLIKHIQDDWATPVGERVKRLILLVLLFFFSLAILAYYGFVLVN